MIEHVSHRIALTALRTLRPLCALRLMLLPARLPLPLDEAEDAEVAGDITAGVRGVRVAVDGSGVDGKVRAGNSALTRRRSPTSARLPPAGRSTYGGGGESSCMSRLALLLLDALPSSVRAERESASCGMLGLAFSCPVRDSEAALTANGDKGALEAADGEKGSDEWSRLGAKDTSEAAGEATSSAAVTKQSSRDELASALAVRGLALAVRSRCVQIRVRGLWCLAMCCAVDGLRASL